LTVAVVTRLLADIAASSASVREFSTAKGPDGTWVNFFFRGRSVSAVWRALHSRGLRHRRWGASLRRASIVTCEGQRGWDDYRLLHHFDPAIPLDDHATPSMDSSD
jgi:hypothetical protein